ncbi:hypothetical protein C7N43_04800 [Sphingobacteriales bacterium UPWRP_1]|nr:hypothetical protein BVG80_07395 [Sphingobacteriales bacterium TSM_CSM]PSJ78252.1 hypothetical protein C7N43_04800 [Sphingobacteriales bacterium UPWRP_1]
MCSERDYTELVDERKQLRQIVIPLLQPQWEENTDNNMLKLLSLEENYSFISNPFSADMLSIPNAAETMLLLRADNYPGRFKNPFTVAFSFYKYELGAVFAVYMNGLQPHEMPVFLELVITLQNPRFNPLQIAQLWETGELHLGLCGKSSSNIIIENLPEERKIKHAAPSLKWQCIHPISRNCSFALSEALLGLINFQAQLPAENLNEQAALEHVWALSPFHVNPLLK